MANTSNTQIANANGQLTLANLPDLTNAEVAPAELLGEYWTPSAVGEKKRVFFLGLDVQSVIEPLTGENRELNIVKFLEKQGNDFRTIRNGSARLVGLFEQFAGTIKEGTPFEITYVGKKKTNTGKYADSWSVKPLIVK